MPTYMIYIYIHEWSCVFMGHLIRRRDKTLPEAFRKDNIQRSERSDLTLLSMKEHDVFLLHVYPSTIHLIHVSNILKNTLIHRNRRKN